MDVQTLLAKDNMRIMSKQTRNNAKTESNSQAQNEHKEGFIEIMFITFMTVIVGIRFALWKFAFCFMQLLSMWMPK